MSAPPGSESGPPPDAWWRRTTAGASTSASPAWLRDLGKLAPEIPATTKLLLCGGVAGAFSKSCTAPLARITILRQLQSTGVVHGWSGSAGMGIYAALAKIAREEGVRALWKGNGVTVLHRLPYSSINFYAYENIMDFLEGEGSWARSGEKSKSSAGGKGGTSRKDDEDNPERQGGVGLGWDVGRRLVAGGSAGMIACAMTYPLDLVRTRLAAQTTVKHYDGLFHALYVIAKKEGPRGLYRGLPPTLVGVGAEPRDQLRGVRDVSRRRRGASGAFYTLVPIRLRSRGERRSLRTFAIVSLRPSIAFDPRPRRLSTSTDAFQLHPDVRSYGTPLRTTSGSSASPRCDRCCAGARPRWCPRRRVTRSI